MEPYEAPVSGTDEATLTITRQGPDTAYRFTTPHTQWSGTYTPATQAPIVSAAWLRDLNTLILLSPDTVTAITRGGPAWTTPIPKPGHPTPQGLDPQGRLLISIEGQPPLRLDPATGHPRLVVEAFNLISDPIITIYGHQWSLTLWGWWTITLNTTQYTHGPDDDSPNPVVEEEQLSELLGQEFLGMTEPETLQDPTTFHFTTAHIQVLIDDLAWEPYVLTTPDGTWTGPEAQWATPTNDPDDSPT